MKESSIVLLAVAVVAAAAAAPQGTREEIEVAGAPEGHRPRRSPTDLFHGKTTLVAIPIAHGAKSAAAVKAGTSAKGLLGALSGALHSVATVPVVAAVVKGAALAPVVKPVVAKAHLAGKVLAHKAHLAGKVLDHKASKIHHFI